MVYYSKGLIKKLEGDLKKEPRSKSFSSLAYIYYQQGDTQQAQNLCLIGIKHHPNHSSAYNLLAQISIDREDLDKALQYLNKAKEISPDNPEVYKKMAQVYKKQKSLEDCLQAYKMILLLQPDNQLAYDTVSYLEKFVPSETQSENTQSEELSSAAQKKIIKLNQMLARVENMIQQNEV